LNIEIPSAIAPAVGGIFFPQRPLLNLGNHAYSPRILHKIVETAGLVKSFKLAAHLLQLNAEFSICGRHVNRLTNEIGAELQQARDQRTEDYVHHRRQPPATPAPERVAASVDGGRINTRQPGCGVGVHEAGWREDKVACLQVLEGPSFVEDPHPEPPQCFLDQEHVKEMVKDFQQQKGLRDYDEPELEPEEGSAPDSTILPPGGTDSPVSGLAVAVATEGIFLPPVSEPSPAAEAPDPTILPLGGTDPPVSGLAAAVAPGAVSPPPAAELSPAGEPRARPLAAPASSEERAWPPQRKDRTCIASLANSRTFGKMVAAEVYARGFLKAVDRAFLGDGLAYNWKIQEQWLKDFTPILDFVHPLSYLYAAAGVLSANEAQRWERYVRWMTASWQGRVSEVLTELRQEQAGLHRRLGEPEGKMSANDSREVLRRTVNYLSNNASRMDYPKYRQRGLPVTSAAVESLIKEFNYRVKGTERFWNRPEGGEAILQVRAAVLSEDGRLEKHILSRPGQTSRRKNAKTAQQGEAA
jgi:hypothetical protein